MNAYNLCEQRVAALARARQFKALEIIYAVWVKYLECKNYARLEFMVK
jgi:hypothetical protein